MPYPTLTEYVKAISDAEDNLDKLSFMKPVLDNQGEPSRSVGGFAVVFKMRDEDTGKMYALKCFHEDQTDRADAYQEISKTLSRTRSSYLMDVQYLPKELFVDTQISSETEFPVLQMDWIEGETMEAYIASHYRDSSAIHNLYLRFCELALWLRSKPFAHGDIKPDNIMIRQDGSLVLIDYDGMFVPSLKGRISPTIGTRSFSHPLRTAQDFDESIDDFALASISISLLAMSENPQLFLDYGAADRLLFKEEDYRNIEASHVYKQLVAMGGVFPSLLGLFAQCLKTNTRANDALYDQIFDLQTKAPEILLFKSLPGTKVYVDDNIELIWEVKNATTLSIEGKNVTELSSYKKKIHKTTEFELVATNGLKSASQKLVINAIEQPSISFKSSSLKLRKGKDESVRLSWKVNNASSAELCFDGKEESIKFVGDKVFSIEEPTEFTLVAVGLDGNRTFTKKIKINVFSESQVIFSSDKNYTLPGVPFTLSWEVLHAKEVELKDYGKVHAKDTKILTTDRDSTYILIVSDAFGTKEYETTIRMLPLPAIQISAPVPKFCSNLNAEVSHQVPVCNFTFPKIDVMGVHFNTPVVPSLEQSGLKVELTSLSKKQITFWSSIKGLFYYYYTKLSQYGKQ